MIELDKKAKKLVENVYLVDNSEIIHKLGFY